MNQTKDHTLRGIVCATLGGVCWGVSGTLYQYLHAEFGVPAMWLTCFRMLGAGVILLTTALPRHGRELRQLLRTPKALLQILVYGIFGLALSLYAYSAAIAYSNAATTTVLQNINLILIMVYTCLRTRRRPSRREWTALLLAFFGTWLLATGGKPGSMLLSREALFWGLVTAAAVAAYTLLPRQLLLHWNRQIISGLGMLSGGILMNLSCRSWEFDLGIPPMGWLVAAGTMLFGSVLASNLFLQGVADIGPVKCGMLSITEPVAATALAAVWLGTRFTAVDFAGFACILATIFLLAKEERPAGAAADGAPADGGAPLSASGTIAPDASTASPGAAPPLPGGAPSPADAAAPPLPAAEPVSHAASPAPGTPDCTGS